MPTRILAGSVLFLAASTFHTSLAGAQSARELNTSRLSSDQELNSKPVRELAQFPPWFRQQTPPPPPPRRERRAETAPPEENSAPAAASDSSSGDFVFAGDLAKQLRKIDPNAKVEWNGQSLRIEASGQKFSVFPTGREMVINGSVEKSGSALRIRGEDIFVPQTVITRIGQELEKKAAATAAGAATTTGTPVAIATPPDTLPVPTDATPGLTVAQATPVPTVLPDLADSSPTPRLATPIPTRTAAATPAAATPAAVTPSAAPTPVPTAPPAATATPFPKATATPQPAPTVMPVLTPTKAPELAMEPAAGTPRSKKTARTKAAVTRTPVPMEMADPLKLALQEKANLDSFKLKKRRRSELESLASQTSIRKVLIHADDSELETGGAQGRQGASIALEIAEKVQIQLKAKGLDVEMVRTSSQRIPLGRKVETVVNSDAQVLVVISVGHSPDFPEMAGYRILYVTDSVDYNAVRSSVRDVGDEVPLEMNYQAFQANNRVLGSALMNSLRKVIDREPIGVNPSPLYLQKRAPMASVAVIVGYLTNPGDAKRLADPDEQGRLATAFVEGITEFGNHLRENRPRTVPGRDGER